MPINFCVISVSCVFGEFSVFFVCPMCAWRLFSVPVDFCVICVSCNSKLGEFRVSVGFLCDLCPVCLVSPVYVNCVICVLCALRQFSVSAKLCAFTYSVFVMIKSMPHIAWATYDSWISKFLIQLNQWQGF